MTVLRALLITAAISAADAGLASAQAPAPPAQTSASDPAQQKKPVQGNPGPVQPLMRLDLVARRRN